MGRGRQVPRAEAIATVIVERLRVFRDRTEIPFGRLTVLAGANSAGKSSAMLPILLLKQTLDAPFDPGALLLSGGHVAIASFDQLRSHGETGPMVLGVETTGGQRIEVGFTRARDREITIASMTARASRGRAVELHAGKTWRRRAVSRVRFMLGTKPRSSSEVAVPLSASRAAKTLEHVLHVPGLRSPPQRAYQVTAVGDTFEGRFDPYVASILLEWERARDPRLAEVGRDLAALGLTWKVRANKKTDTQVSIEVGRLLAAAQGGAHDVVDIADVGVGVSQALPIVVALRLARDGQLVYIEQPELHLHPNAQFRLASLATEAASRGVRVVAETHSSVFLLGVQAAVARRAFALAADDVWLHWFARDARNGDCSVTSRQLDESGSFGDWPADFDSVELRAQSEYMDAVEARRR